MYAWAASSSRAKKLHRYILRERRTSLKYAMTRSTQVWSKSVTGIQCNADDPLTIHGFVSLHPFYVGGSGSQDYWKPTEMQTNKPVNNRQKKGERWTEFVIYLLFGLLPAEDPWAAIITGRGRWQIRQWRVEWNGAGGWTRYHVYIVLTGLRMKMYGNSL